MKFVAGLIALLISVQCYAGSLNKSELAQLMVSEEIIGRDSGETVTEDFVRECLGRESAAGFRLECQDVLFPYYIYEFQKTDEDGSVILILEDGASVENRWVYEAQGGQWVDVTSRTWPDITYEEISARLQDVTGEWKYTPEYVRQVAHSSYRVQYAEGNTLDIMSGIPDESRGEWLGCLQWTGERFRFILDDSR